MLLGEEFYGWVFQMSDIAQLETPKRVVAKHRERLASAMAEFCEGA